MCFTLAWGFKHKRTIELPMWTYKSTSTQASQASTLICHEALTVSLVGLREKWEYELRADGRSLGKGKYFVKKNCNNVFQWNILLSRLFITMITKRAHGSVAQSVDSGTVSCRTSKVQAPACTKLIDSNVF